MRLTFQLRYHTLPGQSLLLTGDHELFGNDEIESAIPLDYLDSEFWRVSLVLPNAAVPDTSITYRYLLREADGTIKEDWANARTINPAAFKAEEVLIIDSWNHPGFPENAFYTEPFREVLLKSRHGEFRATAPAFFTHRFRVKAPLLDKDETLCLLGNTEMMGDWRTDKPLLLSRITGQEWLTAELNLSKATFPIEYKYGVYNFVEDRFIDYEAGPNRRLDDPARPGKYTVVNDGFAVFPVTNWKGAGVAIPVFSLRSQSSFGVGEFTDLKLLADWAQAVGLKLIQILPVNDTTATHTCADSYPYAAISAFALHPLYLNLSKVATSANQGLLKPHEEERKRLNALKDVDYDPVMRLKLSVLQQLYERQRDRTFKSKDYRKFFAANQHWLPSYAAFCYLRDENGTADFNRWKSLQFCSRSDLAQLAAEGSPAWNKLALHYFIQYHLHLQLREASEYAHSKGVILKGDIAIGVYRYGADAWQEPDLYRMQMQAGAPPDAFGIKGQNWSFPTYNWSRMKETGFAWWKHRFEQMGNYFDAFRIDHILGFFRIWSIPLNAVEGILGHFVPAIPVKATEFDARKIRFDPDRYLKPFITDAVVADIFGTDAAAVKQQFLDANPDGRYAMKSQFSTQRQVDNHFAGLEANERNKKLRESLFDLISNVILLPDEEGVDQFHFRFSMETTPSFKNLDAHTQDQLKQLYVDYFFRRQDDFWMKEAMQKLPTLKRVTNMLVCGEDLGMVPACVPETMKQLGLLSLEVQRMPKRLGQEFSYPKDAPYLSVVTPGTHDMSTLRGWWKEDPHVIQRFYNLALGLPGRAPDECEPWINRAIIQQHLDSPAMWSIFMLQDLLGSDSHLRRPDPSEERINVPADAKNYWRYRMHLWLEDLLQASDFNNSLRSQIEQSAR
ncbi:MAG TPA: 4-alpha-glucanotransferase [Patescibacteria group bacterium]|nr:4-alpha-glucanotransferase [Patescibacteria group bacterium]